MSSDKHREYTGVRNELILENVRKIYHKLKIPVWARIPVIPGYNDSVQNIDATAKFVANELGTTVPVHLLAYHRLGESKYERLFREINNVSICPPTDDHILELQKLINSYGLETHIGG